MKFLDISSSGVATDAKPSDMLLAFCLSAEFSCSTLLSPDMDYYLLAIQ